MVNFKKMKQKLKSVGLAILTAVGVVSPILTTSVSASGLDLNTAFSQVVGSHGYPWHYSYQGGSYFDTVISGTADSETLYSIGLDCTAGTIATVAKALANAGYNPSDYFESLRGHLNSEYPVTLQNYFNTSKMTKIADGALSVSQLQAGDIIIYGYAGKSSTQHMSVYAGDGYTIDFTSNGHGSTTYDGKAYKIAYTVGADADGEVQPQNDEPVGADVGKDVTAIWRLNLNKNVNVSVVKKSDCTNITDSNALYSDLSAEFGVYKSEADANSNSNALATFRTDSAGTGNSGNITVSSDVNTLYVKELSAPTNYTLNSNVFSVDVSSGSGSVTVTDTPVNDPVFIQLSKVDSEGKTVTASMAGAKFRVNYYDNLTANSADDVANLTPTRTWVVQTKRNTSTGKYEVDFTDSDCIVSGELYKTANGSVTMPLGCITVEEIEPVAGYTTDGGFIAVNGEKVSDSSKDIIFVKYANNNNSVLLQYGNGLSDSNITKEEDSIRGGFSITKVDDRTGRVVQNGATFAGAEFELYYVDNPDYPNQGITVKDSNGKEYSPGDKIDMTIVLDNNGQFSTVTDALGYGTYKLVETTAPTGMDYCEDITFNINDDMTTVSLTASEAAYYGTMSIHKTVTATGSSFGTNEEGAVFDVVASKYVEELAADKNNVTREEVIAAYEQHSTYANTDADGNSFDGYTQYEYDQLTTDANGMATSHDLAYGTYYIAQVSGAENYDVITDVATFEVSSKDQATVTYEASNSPTNYVLRIVKKDALTGETVTLDSAAYRVKKLTDINGKDVSTVTSKKLGLENGYVTQTLGDSDDQTTYFAYKTVSKNAETNDEELENGLFYPVNSSTNYEVEEGSTALPLQLEAGTYQLEEVITPDGFVTSSEPIVFTIDDASITKVNSDGVKVIEVVQTNAPLEGNLTFTKTLDEMEDADVSFVDHDLSQFGFTLYAAEDIISPDDGSVIIKSGEKAVVYTDESDTHVTELGQVFANQDGTVSIDRLPLGHYTLAETTHPAGTLENTETYDIVIKQSAFDKTVEADNVVASDTVTLINGTETNIDNPYTIENFVTKTWISKKSVTTGEELPGAELTISDKEGNVIDTWTSTSEEHKVEGLTEGETYTLTEVVAPAEYAKATSVSFTIEQEQTKVEMIDKQVDLTKVSTVNDKELEGATIQIFDEEGNIVDEWVSTTESHKISGLEVGKTYTMHEEAAPDGYYYSSDATFTVEDDGVNQHETMYDNIIKYEIAKVDDKNGDYVEGVTLKLVDVTDSENPVEIELPNDGVTTSEPFDMTGKLIAGHSYELTESEYVAGVYKVSGAVEFTVPKTGSSDTVTTVTMVDETTNISVRKVDNYGNPVAGAKMQILEAVEDTSATKQDESESIDDNYLIDDESTDTTTGDIQMPDSEIEGQEEDSEQKPVVNTDTDIDTDVVADNTTDEESVVKYVPATDEDGNEIVVYEFTSTDDVAGVDISQYVKGDGTYILREVEAPFGFEKIEDQVFTVTGKQDSPQSIVAIDARETYYVSAVKVDKDNHDSKLKGAEITLYNADGTIATDVNGKECVGMTDGTGVITWNVEYTDAGYYVQETNAPTGYKINNNHYEVELSSDFFESEEKAYQIVVEDEIKPISKKPNGVGIGLGLTGAGAGSLALLGALTLKDKKKKKEDDSTETE